MVRSRTLALFALFLISCGVNASQALARSDRVKGVRPYESSAKTVRLFDAVDEGSLSVAVIPRDSKQCRVFITNQTSHSLNVQMPAALAAVPVLAQLLPNGPAPAQNDNSAPQRLGVGNPFGQQNPLQLGPNMPRGPMLNQGNQPFFAPFCIAPEKVAQLRLPTVCLDYGHPDPRPAMKYQLVPIATVSDSRELELLCQRLGFNPASQRIEQAVAWHYCDGKSWEDLRKIIVRRLGRPDQTFFARNEIEKAQQLVESLEAASPREDRKSESAIASSR